MTVFQKLEKRGSKIELLAAVTADNGAPVDAVAAFGTLTLTGIPLEDETVTIDTTVYTWKAAPSAAFEVDIGADAAGCVTNLVSAILATSADEGTLFGTGTTKHPTVDAVDGAGDTVVVTALTVGADENSIVTTEASTNMSWGGGTLAGGVDREEDAIEILASDRGQIRTYEITIESSADDAISYAPFLWTDDSPTDLTADQGTFSRFGFGTVPGDLNNGTAVGAGTVHKFRRTIEHMGNARFVYLEIASSSGTNRSISAYLREVIERNA